MRDVGGREPLRPDIDGLYDAFQHSRASRVELPLLTPAEARAYVAEVRDKALDVLDRSPMRRPPAHHRRVRVRHDRPARAAARRDDARHPPAARGRAGAARAAPAAGAPVAARAEVLVPAGPFTMGTSTEPWALDNERPAHVVDLPAFRIDTAPVTNGEYAEFVDAGGYATRAGGPSAGWRTARRPGSRRPRSGRRDGGGTWWRRRFGVRRAGAARRAGRARVLRTRPTPTPPGRASGCPPRRSGRRRPARPGHRPLPPLPVGRRRPDRRARQPRAAPPPARPGRRLPGGRVAAGGAPAHRRRVGVDVLGLAPLPGVRGVPVPRSTPRCSSAATTGCCAAARSAPTRPPSAARSATGTTRSAGRSSRGSGCARDARAEEGR